MKVGIVSDTHDSRDIVDNAVEQFHDAGVDAVLHCGDIIAPFSATPFESEAFDFYAVRGNNDGEWALSTAVDSFGTYCGEMAELVFDDTDFAVYHGTSARIVDALVECGRYDYVCYGHTHQQVHERLGETVRINPGGLPIEGADRRPAAVVVDTDSGDVTFNRL